MLDHPDSPLIPAVGLLYVRYVVDPKEAWGFYKPKVKDETEFDPGANQKRKTISQVGLETCVECCCSSAPRGRSCAD